MEPDGFTQWDRLPVAYPRLHEGVRGRGEVDCMLRCVARIEPYELAARAVKDRGAAHASSQRALAGLADDYASRVERWGERCTVERAGVSGPLMIVLCGVVGPLSLVAVVATDARLSSLKWWPAALLAAPLVLPLTWTALGAAVRLAVPRTTLGRALRDRCCADCGSPLRGLKQGIEPDLVEGAFFGPRACPRCRRPWPLVPPPGDAVAPYSRP